MYRDITVYVAVLAGSFKAFNSNSPTTFVVFDIKINLKI